MPNIVLIRHGQSKWNLENKFTGWKDIDLSENGVNEAIEAGRLIKKHALIFDVAFASVLQRAKKTMIGINHHFLVLLKYLNNSTNISSMKIQ